MEVSVRQEEKHVRWHVMGTYPSCSRQSEAPFSIKVSQSEGLPPTEIYLYGEDVANESILEAETPAHGNPAKDLEATEIKHPHAPKNKRHAASRKFTFDDLKSQNSLIESRDEHGPDIEMVDAETTKGETYRDDVQQKKSEISSNNIKSMEEMEHEEGAYWFADCGVPQIDGQNSFPTVPFDEEPDRITELNLFCNRPPSTLTPHGAAPETDATMADSLESLQVSQSSSESSKGKTRDDGKRILDQENFQKIVPPPVSPKTAAVMAMPDISSFQENLEMAPSDELENRGSVNDHIDCEEDGISSLSDDVNKEIRLSTDGTEGGEVFKDPTVDEADFPVSSEEECTDELDEEQERKVEVEKRCNPEEEGTSKPVIPSVVSHSDESEEQMETAVTTTMGDLRQQLDQLSVSEALEAVSQSFQKQPFLGTEFCGQQFMDWFGNAARKE